MSLEQALANPTVTTLRHDFGDDGPLDARIARLTQLTELQLREVPPELVLPEELLALPIRHLGMSGKDDRLVIPELVRRMPIERLDLWDVDAAQVPPIPTLRALEIVVKDPRVEIAVLAERFSRLTHLEVWGSHLEHGEVPDDIERFSALEALYLVSCGVSELPAALAKLPALRTFGIRGCPMKKFPQVLTQMSRLETLELKAELPGLPAELARMTGLRTLDLNHALNKGAMVSRFDDVSKLKALPRVLGELTQLRHLNLGCCGVFDLDALRTLTELRRLDLAWAGFDSLDALTAMVALEELSLDHCDRVKDLSPLAALTRLRKLTLSRTKPHSLDVLRSLPALAQLDIEGIETKRLGALYQLEVELEADDEIKERYEARASLRGLPTIEELEPQLAARDRVTIETVFDQLAAFAVATSTREENALVALGIPVESDDENDGDDDDDDDEDRDEDEGDDDDDDDDDAEDEEDGIVRARDIRRAGPNLPALDLALDRHLATASPHVLARLFGALFHDVSDQFNAATRIAFELVSRVAGTLRPLEAGTLRPLEAGTLRPLEAGTLRPLEAGTIDEAQCVMIDGFIKANEHYDTGHRYHEETVHDVLLDSVFPLLRGPALAKLLIWASDGHLDPEYGDGMYGLFVPALERASDPAPVLDRLEKFLSKMLEYRKTALVDQVWAMLAPIAKGPHSEAIAAMRGRLEVKIGAARGREQLAKRLADPATAAAAIAEAAAVSDPELEELQGALWRANDVPNLPRDARRQLFLLWERRKRLDGVSDALATAARTASAGELAADLLVLQGDRPTILREAVLKALAEDGYPAASLELLRTLATEHDGMPRTVADSAELRAVLFGAAKNWQQDAFERGIAMLEGLREYVPEVADEDDDDEYGQKPSPANLASMVANLAECSELELLGRFARHLHKLQITGKPLERMLAQLVAVAIVGDDAGAYAAIAPLIPATVTWDILAYNLACKAAKDSDRAATFKYTARALELGKSPDQFLADSDFENLHEDHEFVALLDGHR